MLTLYGDFSNRYDLVFRKFSPVAVIIEILKTFLKKNYLQINIKMSLSPPPNKAKIKVAINPLINDFDKNLGGYDLKDYTTKINIIFPFDYDNELQKYKNLYSIYTLEDAPVDKELIELYFIWDLTTFVVLEAEQKFSKQIKSYFRPNKYQFKPFKTKHLTNKSHFYFNIGLIYSVECKDKIKKHYYSIFKSVIKIQKIWGLFCGFDAKNNFKYFLTKEICNRYPNPGHFSKKILPAFEEMKFHSLKLADLISTSYNSKYDPQRKLEISKKANSIKNYGKENLIDFYIRYISKYLVCPNEAEKNKGNKYFREEKFRSIDYFVKYDLEKLSEILDHYKKIAPEKGYRYALNVQPQNIDKLFRRWMKSEIDFKVEIEYLCNFRKKENDTIDEN